jgi:hypothetical protein
VRSIGASRRSSSDSALGFLTPTGPRASSSSEQVPCHWCLTNACMAWVSTSCAKITSTAA